MNEPDEELERHVPEEPLPERDVLLEALVDQETEAGPRRRISKTLIAACLLTGLGVWQIVHVSNGGEPIFRVAAKAKAAPTKVRSDGRRPIGKVLPSTDPIATYLERAKRGMTDQEIRWMITDFQAAGLDEDDRSLKGTLRAKQQLWYLEALTEALQLSSEQKNQARARMDELLRKDIEAFEQGIGGVTEVREPTEGIPDDSPIAPNADPTTWLLKDAYAPWNLCDLTKEQDQLTLRQWKTDRKSELIEGKSSADVVAAPWITVERAAIQDPRHGILTELPEPTNGFHAGVSSWQSFGILSISDAFPLTPEQDLVAHWLNIPAQARILQPAQLRLGLLFDASLIERLLQGPDNPTAQTQVAEDHVTGITIEPNAPPPITIEPETPVDPLPEPDSK